jgi:hypothetical protein
MSLPPPADHDPRPEPPERPDSNACCGSGCDPCIFDYYAEELDRWRADLAAWEAREAARREAAARQSEDDAGTAAHAKPASKTPP